MSKDEHTHLKPLRPSRWGDVYVDADCPTQSVLESPGRLVHIGQDTLRAIQDQSVAMLGHSLNSSGNGKRTIVVLKNACPIFAVPEHTLGKFPICPILNLLSRGRRLEPIFKCILKIIEIYHLCIVVWEFWSLGSHRSFLEVGAHELFECYRVQNS